MKIPNGGSSGGMGEVTYPMMVSVQMVAELGL